VVVPAMAASDVVVILSSKPIHNRRLCFRFLYNNNMCLH
jgi:hypothetical protein